MKKQASLRTKIIKYLLAFVFAMISLIWLFQTVFLDSFYQYTKSKSLEIASVQVENALNQSQLQETIDSLSSDHEICIRVVQMINSDYIPAVVQYSSLNRPACAVVRLSDEQVVDYWQKAKKQGGTVYEEAIEVIPVRNPQNNRITYSDTENRDMIMAKSIGSDALILLSARISPVNSTVETLRIQLIYITLIICAMALGLGGYMTLKVTRPLEQIHHAAKILATGNVDVTFNASGYKEINELNQTLNYAANKLKEVDQIRRDLIANVSHDLRTPLTMIEGYSEMMRDLPGENTPENAQVIMDEAHRLTLLVNDLLDLSALEEKKIVLNKESINLSVLLDKLVIRYQKVVHCDDVVIELDCESDLIIKADVVRLEQILYNFLNNAVQYSSDNKTIQIRAKRHMNKVRVEIQDHGQGIAQDKLDQIWDRYYKIDKQHKRAEKGSGIGLSICKHLLELHDADYGVISKENQGTTFWFEL